MNNNSQYWQNLNEVPDIVIMEKLKYWRIDLFFVDIVSMNNNSQYRQNLNEVPDIVIMEKLKYCPP